MRQLSNADRIRQLMQALGAEADEAVRVYFTGGATAVLLGWRETTIDVDLRTLPEGKKNTIYVGTGEANYSLDSGYGNRSP